MTDGIYLLLGGNLGDRRKNLEQAHILIGSEIGKILRSSSVFETEAWGKKTQPSFLNQVIIISSNLSPVKLLTRLQVIEKKLGRVRHERWGERTLDIDILYYNNLVFDHPELHIPHPEIAFRRFTLVPLVEIAPDFIHPVLLKTSQKLLSLCKDNLMVKPLTSEKLQVN